MNNKNYNFLKTADELADLNDNLNDDLNDLNDDFELKTQTEEELRAKAEEESKANAEVKQLEYTKEPMFKIYNGFPAGVCEASSIDGIVLYEKTKRVKMPSNYKKTMFYINEDLYSELQRQPCAIDKAIPFLLEWAFTELKRQKKQIVVDLQK